MNFKEQSNLIDRCIKLVTKLIANKPDAFSSFTEEELCTIDMITLQFKQAAVDGIENSKFPEKELLEAASLLGRKIEESDTLTNAGK